LHNILREMLPVVFHLLLGDNIPLRKLVYKWNYSRCSSFKSNYTS